MTKINKEYTLQTFKASVSNTSQFLEGKGYKIPQTTLLHALSVFVGEKNWNTLQPLLKNKPEKQTQSDNNIPKDVNKIINELLDNVERDNDTKNKELLNQIEIYDQIIDKPERQKNDEKVSATLSFIKNRLDLINDEFFINWEKNKCLLSAVKADNDKEHDDKDDTNSIEIGYSNTEKWKYQISQFMVEKYITFNNNILKDSNFFFNTHKKKIPNISLNKVLYSNTLVSTSELNEVHVEILLGFHIFFISEIKKHFITDLDYNINMSINSKNFKNYTIQVFSSQPKNASLDLIRFLRKYLENFQY